MTAKKNRELRQNEKRQQIRYRKKREKREEWRVSLAPLLWRALVVNLLGVLLILVVLHLLLLVVVHLLLVLELVLMLVLLLLLLQLLLLVKKLLLLLVLVLHLLLGIQCGGSDVEALVDDWGDGLDLGAQLLLDLVQVETVLISDQVNGETQVAETTTTTNAVEISLSVLGEIKVDNDVDGLDVDTTGQEIRADQVSADTIPEIVEDAVTMGLEHLCVGVEARVSKFGDLFRQKLDTVG